MPIENLTDNTIVTYTGGSLATMFLVRTIWRRLVRDNTEVIKDRAEANIIETMTEQLKTVHSENENLRKENRDIQFRLGQLEGAQKELAESKLTIEKLIKRLDDKDEKIERLIHEHALEIGKFQAMVAHKDQKIESLNKRIEDLENRLKKDEVILKIKD